MYVRFHSAPPSRILTHHRLLSHSSSAFDASPASQQSNKQTKKWKDYLQNRYFRCGPMTVVLFAASHIHYSFNYGVSFSLFCVCRSFNFVYIIRMNSIFGGYFSYMEFITAMWIIFRLWCCWHSSPLLRLELPLLLMMITKMMWYAFRRKQKGLGNHRG